MHFSPLDQDASGTLDLDPNFIIVDFKHLAFVGKQCTQQGVKLFFGEFVVAGGHGRVPLS
jgi:hypothetical protein